MLKLKCLNLCTNCNLINISCRFRISLNLSDRDVRWITRHSGSFQIYGWKYFKWWSLLVHLRRKQFYRNIDTDTLISVSNRKFKKMSLPTGKILRCWRFNSSFFIVIAHLIFLPGQDWYWRVKDLRNQSRKPLLIYLMLGKTSDTIVLVWKPHIRLLRFSD